MSLLLNIAIKINYIDAYMVKSPRTVKDPNILSGIWWQVKIWMHYIIVINDYYLQEWHVIFIVRGCKRGIMWYKENTEQAFLVLYLLYPIILDIPHPIVAFFKYGRLTVFSKKYGQQTVKWPYLQPNRLFKKGQSTV